MNYCTATAIYDPILGYFFNGARILFDNGVTTLTNDAKNNMVGIDVVYYPHRDMELYADHLCNLTIRSHKIGTWPEVDEIYSGFKSYEMYRNVLCEHVGLKIWGINAQKYAIVFSFIGNGKLMIAYDPKYFNQDHISDIIHKLFKKI